MTNPRTAGEDDEREVIYHAVCPWSRACRDCMLTMRDGDVWICPFGLPRGVRATHKTTGPGTSYVQVQCFYLEEDEDGNDS